MFPDDWIVITGAVSLSLSIIGVAIDQWTESSKKELDAQFHKEVFLETQRIHSIFDEKRQEFDKQKEEADRTANNAADVICDGWFGNLRGDDTANGVSSRRPRSKKSKLLQESETVFKLEEDIQEFTACCSCPDCGQTAFHFINSSDQNSKIMRECISCKKVWLQLK